MYFVFFSVSVSDPFTKLALLKTYCSFYGSVVWDLSQSAMDSSFCAIWRKGLTPTQACLEFAT